MLSTAGRRRKHTVKNARIKVALIENGMKQWQLAQLMGVHEATLSKRMREELPAEEQDRIVNLIEAAEDKQQPEGG
jgi:predicted XRE-type DNA-binding protein